jgi:hypothetical protein
MRGVSRHEFPLSVRKAAFRRCCKDGRPYCESCGVELNARTGVVYEHVTPDGLGGEPTLENCSVRCRTCADIKSFTEDNPRMAKADRVFKRNYGLKKSSRPMPGSKKSGWKRKLDGTVERR